MFGEEGVVTYEEEGVRTGYSRPSFGGAGRSKVKVSAVARIVDVIHAPGGTLAVVSVGDKAFMMPVDSAQAGPMRRLRGAPVTVTIEPISFARG